MVKKTSKKKLKKSTKNKSKKPSKKPPGVPTVLTESVLQELKKAFAIGASDREACVYADIAESTLYNYQKKKPEFLEEKERLKSKPILAAKNSVVPRLKKMPGLH